MKTRLAILLLVFLSITSKALWAQSSDVSGASQSEKVLVSSATLSAIPATLEDAAWLEGKWVGSRESGHIVQHVILGNQVDHMPGFVRSFYEDSVLFYEISVFAKAGESISYRVKHFSYDFTGWEGQNEVINRPLLGKSENTLQFDGITFERTSENTFVVYFRIPEGPTEGTILTIPFERQTGKHS